VYVVNNNYGYFELSQSFHYVSICQTAAYVGSLSFPISKLTVNYFKTDMTTSCLYTGCSLLTSKNTL